MANASKKPADIDSLLTIEDVRKILNVSPRTVYRLVENRGFPAPIRLNRLIRWRRKDVDAWIDSQVSSSKHQ